MANSQLSITNNGIWSVEAWDANGVALTTLLIASANAAPTLYGRFVGGTVTANAPPITVTQTWNNNAVTFTGVLVNCSGGAGSGSESRLQSWQYDGVDKLYIRKDGSVVNNGSGYFGSPGTGGFFGAGNAAVVSSGPHSTHAQFLAEFSSTAIRFKSAVSLGWSSDNSNLFAGDDVTLYRDEEGALAQRHGNDRQKLRVYGQWSDSGTAYERAAIQSGTGYVELVAEKSAGGDLDVRLSPAGTGGRVDIYGTPAATHALATITHSVPIKINGVTYRLLLSNTGP